MARKPAQSTIDANELDRQGIAADIAEFRKRGGRIEILGVTPLRMKSLRRRPRRNNRTADTTSDTNL